MNVRMKVFSELVEDVEILTEANTSGGKNYYLRGIYMQSDMLNKNKRIYPEAHLQNAVSVYNEQYVKTNRAYGELGHPTSSPNINPERISHRIVSLQQEGKNFIGKALISNTPYGQIVKHLIDEGGQLGVSSRGYGSIKEGQTGNVVQEDFRLITAADVVIDPSAPDAFVQAVMEGVEWLQQGGEWVPAYIEETQKVINNSHKADREATILSALQKFMTKIR